MAVGDTHTDDVAVNLQIHFTLLPARPFYLACGAIHIYKKAITFLQQQIKENKTIV